MSVTPATLGERALRRLGVAVVPVASRPAQGAIVPAATIARNALTALGVIAADETPSADDAALAAARVSAVHDALVAQGAVSWALGAIPNAVSDEMAALAAIRLASSFGKQADPARVPVLEARIRHVAMIMAAPALAEEAVLAVHADLAARGKVRWSSADIPQAAELPYQMLAANRLAPNFQQKAEPADEIAAMRTLAQIIALPSSGERVQAEYF